MSRVSLDGSSDVSKALERERSLSMQSEHYEAVDDDESSTSDETSASRDVGDELDGDGSEQSGWTLETALAKYKLSQDKLREAKQTIVSLIDQITDYQSVMDHEKAALEEQLRQKEAVFTELIEETESNQLKQNAETM